MFAEVYLKFEKINIFIFYKAICSATNFEHCHTLVKKLTTFDLPYPCMGHQGCAGRIFLECAADGVFTGKLIKFIIKTGFYNQECFVGEDLKVGTKVGTFLFFV